MSRKIKTEFYTNYSVDILKEFMSEKDLKEMTRKYTIAKIRRLIEHATGKKVEQLKDLLDNLTNRFMK